QIKTGLAVGSRLLLKANGPTQAVLIPDLNGTVVVQSFRNEQVGDLVRLCAEFEINCLHQRVDTLSLVGLDEAGDSTAERSSGSAGIVSVLATQSRPGHEERAGRGYVVVQSAHGVIEQLETQVD